MSRLPRLAIGGRPHLIIQRGVQSQPIFVDDEDRQTFLAKLAEAATACRVAIHAYVLLDSEVALVATPHDAAGLSRMMQSLGRTYVAGFNRRHGRSGTLWQARYRCAVVEADSFLIACMRYVETRPAQVIRVEALDHPWSSAAHHIGRQPSGLVTDHPIYWRLGNTPFEREAAYRSLLERALTQKELHEIEAAALKGWALGSERFVRELARETDRRLRPLARGRPVKRA